MEGKNTSKRTHSAQPAKKFDFLIFPLLYIYWILFGQLVLLLLSLFGYESLRPVIEWVSSVIPSVESLRHSDKVMNADLARAHYALMWLCSPALIIAALFSPVQPGERMEFLKIQSRYKTIYVALTLLLMEIILIYLAPDGRRTLGLATFAIGFAFLSSFFTSVSALSFRYIKLFLTDTTAER